MTMDEKLQLLSSRLPHRTPAAELPAHLSFGGGYAPGVPRLGIPYLAESDAGLGVANMGASLRAGDTATAFPSGAAMASTWDPSLIERTGRAMGAEARGKGFNVLLAGSMNLVREPRNGRNFEYLGEDPLLAGVLGGHIVRGIQSNGVISTIKHFTLNAQETGRTSVSANISEAAMRESDLLAFQIAHEIGAPGSVMCSYNRVNSVYACENSFLLNDVLRRDWHFRGWVMSDWGAVHSVSIRAGLDQESPNTRADQIAYFDAPLRAAIAAGQVTTADVDRSVRRILRTMYAVGATYEPVRSEANIDYSANAATARMVAENGLVLLKNDGGILPIAASAQRILLVGGHADRGTLQGGGSSQVNPVGGPGLSLTISGEPIYHRRFYSPSAPLAALRALLPQAQISYDDGGDPQRAASAARSADLVIVFAEQLTAEGRDVPTISLPDQQDALIDAVAAANRRTVVVLETGGPVAMPWINRVGAVLEAWYPGQRGGEAIARVLSGVVNPSGRLPFTFPRSIDQTPNPRLPGTSITRTADGTVSFDMPRHQAPFDAAYPEGADVGYRWYDRTHADPLFNFGFGLSYTSFAYSDLSVRGGSGLTARFRLANTGARAGIETPQIYVRVNGVRHLVGWSRVPLRPGESRVVTVTAEPRLLARYDVGARRWQIAGGRYEVEVSAAADRPRLHTTATLGQRSIRD